MAIVGCGSARRVITAIRPSGSAWAERLATRGDTPMSNCVARFLMAMFSRIHVITGDASIQNTFSHNDEMLKSRTARSALADTNFLQRTRSSKLMDLVDVGDVAQTEHSCGRGWIQSKPSEPSEMLNLPFGSAFVKRCESGEQETLSATPITSERSSGSDENGWMSIGRLVAVSVAARSILAAWSFITKARRTFPSQMRSLLVSAKKNYSPSSISAKFSARIATVSTTTTNVRNLVRT